MRLPRAQRSRKLKAFPVTAFLLAIGAVCLVIIVTAAYTFMTLAQLRRDYIHKQGHEVAGAIDAATRGPGRRDNPAVWQAEFEKAIENNPDWLRFIVLLNARGDMLASAGEVADVTDPLTRQRRTSQDSYSYVHTAGEELFIFETPLQSPQRIGGGMQPVSGWRFRLGLRTAQATFITKQAYVHLGVALASVAAISFLSFYFLRTLRRFIRLREREESEKHLAALGRMAATLAHEIRNPLGAMKGLTQVAQEELPDGHCAQPLMQTVVSEAERLEQLVTDLMSFARPREPDIGEFDLRALIVGVTDILSADFKERQVDLQVCAAEPLVVFSDENGLRQVLLNVLRNAMEATPPGGAVNVALNREGRMATIRVDDTGEGLNSTDPEDLFQPFATSKANGTGLGLAVSRQIVERLHGTIRLQNRIEGGARCQIRFPVSATRPEVLSEPRPVHNEG